MIPTGKFVRTLSLVLFAAALLFAAVSVSHADSLQGEIESVWQKAQQAAAFNFDTTALQTTHLVSHPANVGRRPQTDKLFLSSDVDAADETMTMSLETTLGGNRQVLDAKAENGTAYIQNANGEWEENPELLNLVAPGGDPMAFLNAMENVEKLAAGQNPTDGTATFLSGEQAPPLIDGVVRYAFTLDGPRLGDYLQQQTEQYLQERKGMPNGMRTETPDLYKNLIGRGELWVDAATELPIQQRIQLEFPPEEAALNYQSVDMVTYFADWELPPVTQFMYGLNRSFGPAIAGFVPSADIVGNIALGTLLLGVAVLTAVGIGRNGRSHLVYRIVVVVLVFTFLLSPFRHILTRQKVEAFTGTMAAEQSQRTVEQAEMEAQQAQFTDTFTNNDFQPTVSPLAQGREGEGDFTQFGRQIGVALSTDATTGTDTDLDFLNDEVEIYELGTFHDAFDTDGDYISDGSEVYGFVVTTTNTTWYLDPWAVDSNGDGLSDTAECPQRVDTADDGTAGYDDDNQQIDTRNNICPDTDGDGVPDVWDFDNDGDSVPDAVDTSPYAGDEFATNTHSSFNFNVDQYDTDELLMLDLRIRPENPDHLWLTGNVYDWPSNDDLGQVTRVVTNTFADYGYTTGNAGNGDLMVIPQVEVKIPYDAGNPSGGLPISSTAPITQGTPVSEWLDTSVTDEYNLTVSKDTDTGDIYLYTSVYDIQDSVGDSVVSWQAMVPYRPSEATWGSDHEFRLLWLVLALTDTCDTAGMADGDVYSDYCDPTNTENWTTSESVVHSYYEDFYVTGLSVEEEQGLTGAYVAQFDELNQSYPQDLWHFTDSALEILPEGMLLTGSQRFSIDDVVTRFDNDSTTYADGAPEKWGIAADALNVVSYTYGTSSLGLSTLIGEMDGFLDDTFPTAVTDDYVTVLQLRETTSRSQRLLSGEANYDTPSNTVTLSFSGTQESLYSAMVWSTYQKTADGWENADEESYVEWLETSLENEFTDQELSDQFNATVNSDVARYVAVDYAVNFYLMMEAGNANLVESDGVPISTETLNDADYALSAGDEVALGIAQDTVDAYYSFIDETATVTLDGMETVIAPYFEIGSVDDFINNYALFQAEVRGDDPQLSINTQNFAGYAVVTSTALTRITTYLRTNWTSTISNFQEFVSIGFYRIIAVMSLVVVVAISLLAEQLAGDGAFEIILISIGLVLSVLSLYRTIQRSLSITNTLQQFRTVAATLSAVQGGEGVNSVQVGLRLVYLYSAYSNLIKALRINIIIDLVVGVVIALVIFFVLAAANNWTEKDIEYQLLLAYTVASITVSVVIFVFFAILIALAALAATGVGLIVVLVFLVLFAIIALVDLIMYAVCYFTDADEDDFICKGIIGSLVMEIADLIYEYHNPVDFEHEERLNIDLTSVELVNQAQGFEVGNKLDTVMTIESRLYPDQPNFDFKWRDESGGKIRVDHLDSASFLYTLNESISVFDIPNNTDWTEDASGDYLSHTYTLTERLDIDTAGINVGFDYKLGEAFKIPLMNCWWAVAGWVCNLDSEAESATFHDLDDVFSLDVFPATFDEFVGLTAVGDDGWRMNWDDEFPVLMDADGDGLISAYYNGADPDDSTADTDGDGLSDYYEETNTANGFNSRLADTDGDGLSDYWELFYGSEVSDSDTDNDGLLDGEERFHADRHPGDKSTAEMFSGGWDIVYDYADDNTPLAWRVSSDLDEKDLDGDNNYDYYEYIYRYNPNVMNDLEIFTAQNVTFDYPGAEGYAKPGNTIPYEMVLFGELNSLLVSYGLLEAELPRDLVQERQAFELVGQDTVTLTGSLYVDPAVLSTTQGVSMTLRAGAYTEPVTPTTESSAMHSYAPLSKLINTQSPYQYYDLFPVLVGDSGRNWRCQDCPTVVNGVARFDGADSIYTFPPLGSDASAQVDVSLESEWSISMWLQPDSSVAGSSATVELATVEYNEPFGTAQLDMLSLELSNQTQQVWADIDINNSCAVATVTGGTTFTYDAWNHIAFTYNGAELILYVNGEAGTPVAANKICDDNPVNLNTNGTGYTGEMRDLASYTTALSEEAVRREAFRGFRRLDLNFDEPPASESFADTRGFDLQATCNSNQDQCPLSGVAGVSNQAVLLDGADKLRISADSDQFGLALSDAKLEDMRNYESSFTVMSWVTAESWDSGNLDDALFSFSGSENSTAYPDAENNNDSDYYDYTYATDMAFGFSNGVPAVAINNQITITNDSSPSTNPVDETFTYHETTGSPLAVGDLHHVAFVYDAAALQIRIYVDGVQAHQFSVDSDEVAIPNNMKLDIGDGYHGFLDHFVLSTQAHTVDEIQAIMKESPAVNLHLDEDIDTTAFANNGTDTLLSFSCSGADCPAAGVDGQMREAARFSQDGGLDDKITAVSPTVADDDYSIGFWFYSEDTLNSAQTLFADDGTGYQPVIRLESDRTLTFLHQRGIGQTGTCTYREYTTAQTFEEEQWHHVFFVFNVAGETMTAFVNGVETSLTQTAGDVTEACPTADQIVIGNSFIGEIDELVYYQSELLDFEAEAIFDYQSAWYDLRVQPSLQIDADKPTVDLQVGNRFNPGTYQDTMLPLYVSDVGSGVEEIVIETYYNGSGLPFNTTTLTRTETTDYWIFTIPDQANGSQADLVFRYYAVDGVGNNSGEEISFLWGDNTLPEVVIDTAVTAGDGVTVTGSVNDSNDSRSSDDSGVVTDTFRIRLAHQNGVDRTDTYSPTISNEDWSQQFDLPLPYGRYDVEAYLEDVAGNVLDFDVVDTLVLDALAPFGDIGLPTTTISVGTSVLNGTFHQLGYPGDSPAVLLHFDEPEPLFDSSGTAQAVTCIVCPTTTPSGLYDTSAVFAGSEDLAIDFTNYNDELTLMGWFRPTWSTPGYAPVLFSYEVTGTTRFNLAASADLSQLLFNDGTTTTAISTTLTADSWQHIALIIDDAGYVAVYLDGEQIYWASQTIPVSATGVLSVGSAVGTDGFVGEIDDFIVYDRALLDTELYDMAYPVDAGLTLDDLYIRFRHIGDTITPTWETVTFTADTTLYATWQYSIPDDLEGPYRLELRAGDSGGFERTTTAWNGMLDNMPPRVSLAEVAPDTFVCTLADYNLDTDTVDCPIDAVSTEDVTADAFSWYSDTFGSGIGQVVTRTITGTWATGVPTTTLAIACDTLGQCQNSAATIEYNRVPVATDDTYTLNDSMTLVVDLVTEGLLANDLDLDGDTLTVTAVADPQYGSIAFNAAGTFTYTTDDGDAHTDVFTYTVSDGEDSDTGTVTIDTNSCRANDTEAANETELNAALDCFDTETSGAFRIAFTADITLTARPTSISNNQAELTLDGNGHTISHQGQERIFSVTNTPHVTFTRMTIADGYYPFSTGGGGLIVLDSTVTISGSAFVNNASNGFAGAIYADDTILHIENSLFYSNTAEAAGGALYLLSDNTVFITNTTFHDNASGDDSGLSAVIYSNYRTTLNLNHVSITDQNDAADYGVYLLRGDTTIANSVIADFTTSCGANASNGATILSGGNNLTDDAGCSPDASDTVNTNPQLGTLQDNGGPTWTRLPQTGSPLIDGAGTCAVTADQRGVPRPQGTDCDIGAVEVWQSAGPVAATISSLSATDGQLDWTDLPGCTADVYEDTANAYFTPGTPLETDASTPYLLSGRLGDTAANYFYQIGVTCNGYTAESNTVGVFTFEIAPGD